MTAKQEMRTLWRAAEARRDAGESPASADECGLRKWLTSPELLRFRECWVQIQDEEADLAAQAAARLQHRRAA